MGRSMIRRVRFTRNLDSRHSRNLFKEKDLDGTIEAPIKHNFNKEMHFYIVFHIFMYTLYMAFSIASASKVDMRVQCSAPRKNERAIG